MTERIERVKDALGMGGDRTHDDEVERLRPAPADGDPQYADRQYTDPQFTDPQYTDPQYVAVREDEQPRLLGDETAVDADPHRDADRGYDADRQATRRVDPSFTDPADPVADPVATGDSTWAASDSPAETTVMPAATGTTGTAADPMADPMTADPMADPMTADPMAGAAMSAGGSAEDEARWRDLQARFVDEPEAVTREAAVMVDQAVSRLTQALASAGGDGSTENLRHAFRRYRDVYRTLTDA